MIRIISQVQYPKPLPSLLRVAAYTRVSSGKDAMLHSLSMQVSYYNSYIQRHKGWQYVGVYSDEAMTGTKETRDGFQRLLQDCRDGKIDLVITKSISRFARNTVTLLNAVRELKDIGVDVYFEEQNIHTMSGEGELMLTILASYAQEESRSVSENMKWRIRMDYKNGALGPWRFLYGYTYKKGKFEINPCQSEIIKEIFQSFLGGASLSSIAKNLNDRGIPGTHGGKWYSTHIAEILGNEKFTGNTLLQKTYVNNHIEKKKVPNRGELPKYYVEDTHPAIIDKDTFERVQERLKEIAPKKQRPPKTIYPFTSKIVCMHCGTNFQRIKAVKFYAWRCGTFCHDGKAGCTFGRQIPEDTLMQLSAEVLGLPTFDKTAFERQIDHIEVCEPSAVEFVFKDGRRVRKKWQERSRRESWTEEMKQVARERAIIQNQRRKS